MSVGHGDEAHPVLDVLRGRRERGDRADGHRVGLAVQGGGMRGVVSAAMVVALEDLGFGAVFDAVYGASSGALNAAYFLGGEGWQNLAAYYDDLVRREFIDLRHGPVGAMNLDYAIDEVLCRRKPLDFTRVLKSDTRLHVAVARLDPMGTEVLHDFGDADALKAALKASAWLPPAVRGTAELAGRPALDGAMLTIHPYRLAVADGCTHVLSLTSRRIGPVGGPNSMGELVLSGALERIRPGLGRRHRAAVREYQADRAMLRRQAARPAGPPYLLDLAPLRWMPAIRPFERDPGRLIVTARYAYELLYRAVRGEQFAGDAGYQIIPRFTPVREAHGADA